MNEVLDEDRARQIAVQVVESGRRQSLEVLSQFHRLIRLDRERHTATIESAVPLPDDIQADVEARLVRAYGPWLERVFVEKPSLIGGLRARIGSDVYDGSVRGRLDALAARFASEWRR